MLQSKKGNMIISLILAIALWMYVVGETNPEVTESFRNIPVTLENEQTLADSGLAVVKSSKDSITVTLSGRRSVINKIKSTDITASVDLSDAMEGDNQIRVDVKIPSQVEIRDQSPSKITVTVDERVTEEKEVRTVYVGTAQEGMEPAILATEPAKIEVTGARSAVAKVAYVGALCDMEDIREKETFISCRLTPFDKNGVEVDNVTLSEAKAVVNTVMYHTAEVDLKVDIIGKNAGGYERTVEVPEKMSIKGSLKDISKVKSVTCETVDLSDVTKSGNMKLKPDLPKGIMPVEGGTPTIKVKVE